MNKLVVNEEEIKGFVKDIKAYMINELYTYIVDYPAEKGEIISIIHATDEILQTIIDCDDNNYVTLRYNPMGAWYIENDEEDKRYCSICGKEMTEGYYNEDEFQYYCSDECLHKDYTDEEYNELYDNGNGNFYWTQWEE